MLILVMLLKFESTDKINGIWCRYHNCKDNEDINCWYLSNEMKYEAEIWYLEVIYDYNFDYDMKILINWQN